jgi:hypothetical protein
VHYWCELRVIAGGMRIWVGGVDLDGRVLGLPRRVPLLRSMCIGRSVFYNGAGWFGWISDGAWWVPWPGFCGFLIWFLLGFQFNVYQDLNLTEEELQDDGCMSLLWLYFAWLKFSQE